MVGSDGCKAARRQLLSFEEPMTIFLDVLSPQTNAILVALLYGGDWQKLVRDLTEGETNA